MKESTRHPGLFVLKYKHRVFYENLWTPELQELRGLVVDKDWNVIIYPFTKIFNRHENGTDFERDDIVVAVRKVNGFMACATLYQGKNIISTTGSLDSPFVELAENYLKDLPLYAGYTYIFEICDWKDKHIIEEKPGAYLIGCRVLVDGYLCQEGDLDFMAAAMNLRGAKILRPEWEIDIFNNICLKMPTIRHEGFVIRHRDGRQLKIKSPYYLVTKFLARKRGDKLLELMKDPKTVKPHVDEEFYPLIDYIHSIKNRFAVLSEDERILVIEEFLYENSVSRH